jgi:hypothetical protein
MNPTSNQDGRQAKNRKKGSSNGQLKKFQFLVTAAILNGRRGCRTQI